MEAVYKKEKQELSTLKQSYSSRFEINLDDTGMFWKEQSKEIPEEAKAVESQYVSIETQTDLEDLDKAVGYLH